MPAPQPNPSQPNPSQPNPSQPGGDAGRVRCLYCGANNFPASAACWQCSRPLKAMPEAPANAPQSGPSASLPGLTASAPPRPRLTESPLAPKAAVAMGLLFPLIGLPAGMIFLMLDDPRKTYLGWLMIGWSIGGTVLSVVPLLVTLGPLLGLLHGLAPHPGGSPPSIPGLPTDGSAGDGLRLLLASLLPI